MSGWGSSVTERPEVQDENVGRAGFSQGLTPWLVDGHLPCVLTWPSICTCPNLLLRTLIRLDCDSNGSTLMTTFNLITTLKTLPPNAVTFQGPGAHGFKINLMGLTHTFTEHPICCRFCLKEADTRRLQKPLNNPLFLNFPLHLHVMQRWLI